MSSGLHFGPTCPYSFNGEPRGVRQTSLEILKKPLRSLYKASNSPTLGYPLRINLRRS